MERMQSPIVPEGNVQEKRYPHRPEEHRGRQRLELALIILIVLFIIAVFGLLIYGSRGLIDSANLNLPK